MKRDTLYKITREGLYYVIICGPNRGKDTDIVDGIIQYTEGLKDSFDSAGREVGDYYAMEAGDKYKIEYLGHVSEFPEYLL